MNKRNTIDLMQLLSVEIKIPVENDVVIEFIPRSDGSKLWARKAGQRMEIESVDCQHGKIDEASKQEVSQPWDQTRRQN